MLFGVDLYVRREITEHFVFDYKNADWNLFRRELDSLMDLNYSLDRIMSEADFDYMVQSFSELIFEARVAAVLLIRPNRFSPCKSVLL
jgi:hypothetical protein